MSEDISISQEGALGVIHLNRPERLNALSADMAAQIGDALADWRSDDAIKAALIKSTGPRAFCAGGDVQTLCKARKAGDLDAAMRFFAVEYRNNWRVKHFEKPYIALMDGVIMGGGVGVSVHGDYRIATENSLFAMPECGIGLFPDVGATHFLSRLSGESGTYLGLTGARIKASDMLGLGIATHCIDAARLEEFTNRLAASDWLDGPRGTIEELLEDFHQPPLMETPLINARHEIDAVFSADSVEEIIQRLEGMGGDWASETLAALRKQCPISLKITLEAIRRAAHMAFDEALAQEYRMTARCVAGDMFMEGVRAQVIDKDRKPHWRPDSLAGVSPAMVEAHFEALPADAALRFDWERPTATYPEAIR